MKRFLLVIPVWICLIVSAQSYAQTITFERHTPHTSDSLLAYKLPYTAVTDSGRNCIWDFSDLPTDSAEVIEINHYATSVDTLYVGVHREHANYYYHCMYDALCMTGYENSRTHVRYSDPLPMLRYPLAYGDSIQGMYTGKGQYCHILPIETEGVYAIHADATGKLMLPGMEVDSVLRVHNTMQYHEKTYHQNKVKEESYRWYSPYCRYPLIETTVVQTIEGVDTISVAYLYYIPQDPEDLPDREQEEEESPLEGIDSLITDISFMPNPVYADLQVNYTLVRAAQVYISVHYNGGVTTYQTPLRYEEEGSHSVGINMSGMPIGSYVVYIHADDMVVSGNIIKL